MSFWEPCFHSLWICPSVFLWTCHLQPSRPSLPPFHSSPNTDLMLTSCWPLTHIFILYFLRLVVHLLSNSALENLTISNVRPVTDTPHTNCVLSTHWEGGGDPHSLSLILSVIITVFYIADRLLLHVFSNFTNLSHPFFPWLSACLPVLHVHDADFHCSSPPVFARNHWNEGSDNHCMLETQTTHCHMMLHDQQMYIFAWHAHLEWLYNLSLFLPSDLLQGG